MLLSVPDYLSSLVLHIETGYFYSSVAYSLPFPGELTIPMDDGILIFAAVLTFDYCGMGKSGGHMGNLAGDMASLMRYLRAHGYPKIVCAGRSMGGGACLHAAHKPGLAGLVLITVSLPGIFILDSLFVILSTGTICAFMPQGLAAKSFPRRRESRAASAGHPSSRV